MSWNIEYSKRAIDFTELHGMRDKVRESVKNFIIRITGSSNNIDVKKLKGEWSGYYRIRKGKVRIIVKPDIESRTIFVDTVDFRGNVYK
ncbi:MAG: type II toxin-antitoxin system RelE/ParE family toxin [Deltaproteobacteria bacterium]|nr:type II toxin-antitoxin system RelE/ParE family toxin [Deltaproteobacteria bacterium]